MVLKAYAAVLCALLCAGCGAPVSRQSTAHGAIDHARPEGPAGSNYRIDSSQSELRILVYRAGPMAALGHNHVIVNRTLGGWVRYAGTVPEAAFALTVPDAGFVVDDDGARHEEGADFADETPEEARSGTMRNMQSPALLDSAEFPEITVKSVAVNGVQGEFTAAVAISVAGHESTLEVPFTLDMSPGRLTVSGALWVRQSALGLTPFSVMMGALRVRDDVRIKFRLVATLH
ncbi:MAG: YceI family protein [Steroidobacteraceae bacterium]